MDPYTVCLGNFQMYVFFTFCNVPHLRSLSRDSVEFRKSSVRSLPSSRCRLSGLGHTLATMFTFFDRGGMYVVFAFNGVSKAHLKRKLKVRSSFHSKVEHRILCCTFSKVPSTLNKTFRCFNEKLK